MFAFQPRSRSWLLAVVTILLPAATAQADEVKTEQLMCEVYSGVSGFGIPQNEEAEIVKCGGAPTYGEILYESLKIILDNVPAELKENGIFIDLGSGVGKTCFQAYFDYPFKAVLGIELSQKRFEASMDVYELLQEQGLLVKGRKLKFINEDFTKTKLKGATVIYMCSTCYSNELMDTLAAHMSKLKPGMQVITLKAFPNPEQFGFELVQEYKLPMTWSKDTGGSPVHVYELKGKAKKAKKAKKEKKEKKSRKKKRKDVEEKEVEREDKH